VAAPEDEDATAVARCRKGDPDAFEPLVVKYEKKMFAIAYRMIGNHEDATEVVQDAFLSAYRHLRRFRGKAKFSTWLTAIVVNTARNRLKKLKGQRRYLHLSVHNSVVGNGQGARIELPSSAPSPVDVLENKDIERYVKRCVGQLESEFREVLILRDMQGLPYDEIGRILDLPDGTVKSRLFRGRSTVKDCLRGLLGDL
jgi:RNA polymerase sigma-70 factor (ECF subfamily)